MTTVHIVLSCLFYMFPSVPSTAAKDKLVQILFVQQGGELNESYTIFYLYHVNLLSVFVQFSNYIQNHLCKYSA